ncbi:hypothetical protein DICPUDRAFT_57488 [Dictyostelium purpureum]|uniref:protein-histidine N-methyltransferase n=1 Tax=Dictyostelium purpureum TaxID=5786 RepID=F0ZW91_DICPU|nr:uncharacterized protein DICPUDRAFT_57488 [Dictyostelium purpureum]EGC31794.1 hypothetical protein DICPUDRAFT_57488 [Dictyostelium purpureum]|eukprot:XP_003291689.1 hypothetical protein DICPUDRAFT_57488 [Dictyostelium purpureum]
MIKTLASIKQQIEKINEHDKETGYNITINDFKKSLDLFDGLKKLQQTLTTQKQKTGKQIAVKQETDQQLVSNFMEWLKNSGFDETKSKVKIGRNLAEGSGLVSTCDIKEGEEFLEIPEKLFIDIMTALKSFGQSGYDILLRDNLIRRVPNLVLALYLIKESTNPDSSIAPYLKVLPKTYSTIGYWGIEDFKQLEGSPVFQTAVNYTRGSMRQYCYFYQLFDNNPGILQTSNFTYEAFIWAVATVQSRQNPVGGGQEMALIPFWDFCNHSSHGGKITTFIDPVKHVLTCSAAKSYKKGEQVYMYYGPRPNSQFYLFQGFSLKTNLNDDYSFDMDLDNEDDRDIAHDKIHILEERCGLRVGQTVSLSQNPSSEKLPAEIIPFYRIAALSPEETKKLAPPQEEGHHHHHQGPMDMKPEAFNIISEENEKKAFKLLLDSLKARLSGYPTTLAQDEQEMKNNPTTQRRYVLYILINEKKILERNIKYVEQLIEKGVMNAELKKIEFSEEESCGDDHGDHGHSHAGGHNHSHGGHGHSHGGHGHKH